MMSRIILFKLQPAPLDPPELYLVIESNLDHISHEQQQQQQPVGLLSPI
jgi:hypothetical protein